MRINLLGTVICFFLSTSSIYADWIGQPYWYPQMSVWASSAFSGGMDSIQTVNGYTGSFDYLHGKHTNNGSGYGMWMTQYGGTSSTSPSGVSAPAWIAYDFGQSYPLTSIDVWNYNQAGGVGRGLKSVKIDISRDYQNWRTIFEGDLNKATELDGMLCTDIIPCDESTRYVVINGFSHWDTSTGIYYGLSEVRFNLPGPKAANPAPKDQESNTQRQLLISWKPGIGAQKHDVYLGTGYSAVHSASASFPLGVYKGRQDPNTYQTDLLQTGTAYYWRIDEIDQNQNLTTGNVWSFTVDSGQATSPVPPDKRIQQPRNVSLSWQKGLFASIDEGQDIYFGMDFNEVNNADIYSDNYIHRQGSDTFDPGMLLPNTTYFWRIDSVNSSDIWKGPVWSFKTRHVNSDDFIALAQRWISTGCDYSNWCDGADYDYNRWVDFSDYAQFVQFWAERPLRLMPVGDSITRGLTMGQNIPGGYRTKLYNRIVNELFDIDFVGSASDNPDFDNLPDPDHEGHGGYRIDQIATSITPWLNLAQPDIVLIHLGTNDIAQDYLLPTAPDRLDTLISSIVSIRSDAVIFVARIIKSTNPNENSQIDAFNSALPDIVASHTALGHKVILVEMNTAITSDLFYDIYHPNKAGYDKMADVWFESIKQYFLDRL